MLLETLCGKVGDEDLMDDQLLILSVVFGVRSGCCCGKVGDNEDLELDSLFLFLLFDQQLIGGSIEKVDRSRKYGRSVGLDVDSNTLPSAKIYSRRVSDGNPVMYSFPWSDCGSWSIQ